MTNEQKRQLLEYMGYRINVDVGYIIASDKWKYSPAHVVLNIDQLIDIAWQHLEAREQAWRTEYIAHGTVRYIDIQMYPELVTLYYEINSKFEFMNYPQVMKMFYDNG